jgi:hypothetical protein
MPEFKAGCVYVNAGCGSWTVPNAPRVSTSGRQPAQNWLTDHVANGSKNVGDGSALEAKVILLCPRLISALDAGIGLMGEIDTIIDYYGG